MTASYQNQKFLIDGKYYSYEQLIPPIEEPNIASKIKSFRPPEPYKGKGIKEQGQYILRKEGKKK